MARQASYEARVNECWQRAVAQNPNLFNGTIVSPLRASVTDGACELHWHHSDFAHYMYSRQNLESHDGATVGTIFVSVVLPISERAFILGKMSEHTSTPGVVQLPGGGVSVESGRDELVYGDAVATAADEVREELGINLDPSSLRFIGIIRRETPPDIGLVFMTEPHSWDDVIGAFSSLQELERSTGAKSEFSEVLAIDIGRPVSGDSYVDYLPAVAKTFANRGSLQ